MATVKVADLAKFYREAKWLVNALVEGCYIEVPREEIVEGIESAEVRQVLMELYDHVKERNDEDY